MNIRPETPADYARIADLQVHAFGGQIGEALLITLLRQRPDFDPELSLVVEVDHRIIGHILLSPYTISLLGQPVKAVNLAPIGIETPYQRQGIGEALVLEGHRIAQSKDYVLSFLVGYETFYTRFGYKPDAYGSSSVTLTREQVRPSGLTLEARPPTEADCPSLFGLSMGEEYNVDFALRQGESLVDWISLNPNVQCRAYVRDGIAVGYTRVNKDEPDKVRMFLAKDAETARTMVSMLLGDLPSLTLSLHPYSKSAAAFEIKPQVIPWKSALACGLAPGPFEDYYAQVEAGTRPPGRVIWPVAYDFVT
ncbi:MAG: N-acetyltransferase [Chloroflexota bacterium]